MLKPLPQMKSADAARRSFALIAFKTDHDGRAAVFFHDARRNNAEYTRMPAIAGEHQRMTAAAVHHGSGAGKSLFKYSRFHRSAFAIVSLEFLRNPRCDFARFRRQ